MHWLARSFVPSLGIVSSGDAGLILRVCLHANRKITSLANRFFWFQLFLWPRLCSLLFTQSDRRIKPPPDTSAAFADYSANAESSAKFHTLRHKSINDL